MNGRCSGVSTRFQELNSQAIYIHCFTHRLNLALVDASKAVDVVEDFFILLKKVYVFMSSSTVHSRFLLQQRSRSSREIRLKSMSDTRWWCSLSKH